jgi:hypothetical protein
LLPLWRWSNIVQGGGYGSTVSDVPQTSGTSVCAYCQDAWLNINTSIPLFVVFHMPTRLIPHHEHG